MSRFLLYSTKLHARRTREFSFRKRESTFTNLYLLRNSFSTISTSPNYLTAPNKSFTVSYLIDSCGLSEDLAISTSKKIQFKTPVNPDSVLNLFRKHEFSETQISKIIHKCPALLLANPDQILNPKLQFLKSIGLTGPQLAAFVCNSPQILNRSLERKLKPVITFLKDLGLTQNRVIKLITRSVWVFSQNPQTSLAPSIALLQTHGVPNYYISKLLVLNPKTVLNTDKLTRIVEDIMEFKIEPSKASFIEAVHVLSGLRKSSWEYKCNIYKRWGWSEDDICMAFRIKPYCMMISEKKVTAILEFLVNKIGYCPSLVSNDPFVLTYSVEKRIIPRLSVIHVLIVNGLLDKDFSVCQVLRLTDNNFLKKFIIKYEEEVPSLLNVYQGKK